MNNPLKESRIARSVVLAAAIAIAPTLAVAELSVGGNAGKTEAELRAYFEQQGYTVHEIETEDAETEIELVLGEKEFEVTVETATGRITGIEEDD